MIYFALSKKNNKKTGDMCISCVCDSIIKQLSKRIPCVRRNKENNISFIIRDSQIHVQLKKNIRRRSKIERTAEVTPTRDVVRYH